MEKKLSIIIPVYNVEKYLEKCINSILIQNDLNQIEIILVDDGSTDESGRICDEIELKAPNISTYHKRNGGLSDARNYGLNLCNGEYVFFVDSDDEICEASLSIILDNLKKFSPEILLFDAKSIDEDGKDIKRDYKFIHDGCVTKKCVSGNEIISSQLRNFGDFITTVWLGVYKKEYLIENNLLFEKGLIHEDELWTPKTLLCAEKVYYHNEEFYKYRIRNNSIMRDNKSNEEKHIKAFIYIYSSLYYYYNFKIADMVLKRYMLDNLCNRYLYIIVKYKLHKYRDLYKQVDKKIIYSCSYSLKNKIRSIILLLNKYVYSIIFGVIRNVIKNKKNN